MDTTKSMPYRNDIDGLRAISVVAVILFHLGYLPNGYLGVDVFFVISGYLITKIIYSEASVNSFSGARFYLRRIRRIIPLVLFTTLITLFIGCLVMLPDDLENLCQSIIATNLFSNNMLLFITTGNYWDTVNEYKPLMHTWSLGIEEQFYVLYPIIFLILQGKRIRYILPVLLLLTAISLTLFMSATHEATAFYWLPFRFFELSIGGVASILFTKKGLPATLRIFFALLILVIFLYDVQLPAHIKLLVVVGAATLLLISNEGKQPWSSYLLENPMMVGIGKISFSLYLWHQIVLAFAKYFVYEQIGATASALLFVLILVLSILSYFLIEQPFRNANRVSAKTLLLCSGLFFAMICSASYYLYRIGGVIRDVPELSLYKADFKSNSFSLNRNIHNEYNQRIYYLDKPFADTAKTNLLVIGNSFARDFANILYESKELDQAEISYVPNMENCATIAQRLREADFIFFTRMDTSVFTVLQKRFHIDAAKVWNVGTKNFGTNNGIFYNQPKDARYCLQRTRMSADAAYLQMNHTLQQQWGNRYIDLIGAIIDKEGKVPVFTPDCKFISQDCRHLTRAGAVYFAELLHVRQLLAGAH